MPKIRHLLGMSPIAQHLQGPTGLGRVCRVITMTVSCIGPLVRKECFESLTHFKRFVSFFYWRNLYIASKWPWNMLYVWQWMPASLARSRVVLIREPRRSSQLYFSLWMRTYFCRGYALMKINESLPTQTPNLLIHLFPFPLVIFSKQRKIEKKDISSHNPYC